MALDYVGQPAIQPSLLPKMIDGLVDELAPDSIMVWPATPGRNTRRPLLVWADGKQRPELEGRVEPLFSEDPSKVGLVVQILNGEVLCTDSTPWSPIGQVLTGDGVTWGCVVGIPPEESSLVGVIVVGFRDKREGEHMRIRLALKRWSRFVTGKDH